MLDVFLVIAPLFLVILVGAFLERLKIATEDWVTVLNRYALYVGLPALIFSSLSKTSFEVFEHVGLIVANSVFLILSFVFVYFLGRLLRWKKKMLKTLFICLAFGNVAYLGIPTLVQLYGDSVLPVSSLLVAVYVLWMFTIGIGFLEYQESSKGEHVIKTILSHLAKNPLLISVAAALIVAIFNIPIPGIFTHSIDMVAASVTPIVLIVLGLFIGNSKIGKIKEWVPILLFSFATLFVLPGLFCLGLYLFGHSLQDFSYSIIDAAMPLAITPFALVDKYRLHKGFVARAIVLSTVLSVLTIPFWVSIL